MGHLDDFFKFFKEANSNYVDRLIYKKKKVQTAGSLVVSDHYNPEEKDFI